jgi:hypothetical protein
VSESTTTVKQILGSYFNNCQGASYTPTNIKNKYWAKWQIRNGKGMKEETDMILLF